MTQNQQQLDPFFEADQPLNLRLILYKYLLRYWYLYVACLAIGIGIAYTYLRYATRQYQVRSTILIRSPETTGSEVSEEFVLNELGLSSAAKNVQNEMQILKSRTLMKEVIAKINLHILYQVSGRVTTSEVYTNSPVLVDYAQPADSLKGLSLQVQAYDELSATVLVLGHSHKVFYGDTLSLPGRGSLSFERNPLKTELGDNQLFISFINSDDIAQSYAGRVSIKVIGEWSNVLELTLKDAVPEKAADVLNALADAYNEAAIKDKNKVAENTYQFINERLKFLTAELSEAEGEVEQFKTRNTIPGDIMQNVATALEEFRSADNQLLQLQLQKDILDNLETTLTSDNNNYNLLPANFVVNNADLTNQTLDYNQLIQNRQRLLKSVQETHPSVIENDENLVAMKTVLLGTLRNVRTNLKKSTQQLQDKVNQMQGRLRNAPSIERELVEITRQKNIKENLYIYLLQKREESALSMAVAAANARVIDPAVPNFSPVEPKSQLSYAMALLLGLGLPLLFVVLLDLLNDKVQTEEDIRKATKTPVLGAVAHSRSGKNIVVGQSSRSAIAEMFRLLRTNLQFLNAGKTPQVILITSSTSGEGKTFLTVNLGLALALSGKKTVVVGMDLRKPKLGRYLGYEHSQLMGVSHYLIGDATTEHIVHQTNLHDQLYFIPTGPIPPNPAELLLQDRTTALFDYLRANFDYVLVDTPPAGLVSDTLLLNPYATGSLFVVRYGQTKKGMLNLVEELYSQHKLSNMAIVFNGVKAKGGYGYGYGYGYGGYGYGYYEEEK